jgi:hypothetical protein
VTVSTEKSSAGPWAADGSTSTWPFDFRVDAVADVQLVQIDAAGVETVLDGSSWTIPAALLGQDAGGYVAYPTRGSPPVSGYSFRVERRPPFTQQIGLKNQAKYDAGNVETALDRAAWRDQYLLATQRRHESRLAAVEGVIDLLGPLPTFPKAPFLTTDDLGLAGDGVTDDAPLLKAKADYWSEQGGATFFLQAPGGAFLFRDRLRLGSALTVIFASVQHLGAGAGVDIAGDMADTSGRTSVLAVAAGVGDTVLTLDTSLSGGSSVSGLYPVLSQVSLRGSFGSAGYPAMRQSARVTATSDGAVTVTVTPALLYAFPAGSTVDLQVTGYLAGDAARDTSSVTLATGQASQFLAGDLVIAQDDKRAADVAGSSTARVRRQVARIAGITGEVVTFDRPLEFVLETSYRARLTLLDAAEGSTVQGASAVFVEAPAPSPADPIPTFQVEYASSAAFFDAAVLNEDTFGSRGPGCRGRLCIDSFFYTPEVRNPKYVSADGDGDGVALEHASDCAVYQPQLYGCRRSVVVAGSARCVAVQAVSQGALAKDIHFAGQGERRCRAVDPRLSGSAVAGTGTRQAITFGDETVCGGSSRCTVEGGTINHYNGGGLGLGWQGLALVWVPGTDNCEVRGTRLNDVEIPLQILDVPSLPALVCVNPRADVEVDGASDWLGYFNGHLRNPSAGYTIQGLDLRLRARNCGKLLKVEKVSGATFQGLNLDSITPNASNPYVVEALDVTSLVVTNGFVRGAARGVSVQTCPSFVIDQNEFYSLTVGELLRDVGGSDAGIWGYNPFFGFDPTYTVTGASAIGYVRTPGVRSLADDTAIKIKPARRNGKIYFTWGPSTGYAQYSYQAGTSPAAVRINGSGASFGTGTTALAGTTGTDGQLNFASASDGYVYIENRTGGALAGFEWENIL